MSLHKHRSRMVTQGLSRAPRRAFLRGTGFDDEALQKSIVGIVSTQGENTPCSMSLAPQADRAQIGRAPSELQSLRRTSYAVLCLNNKKTETIRQARHTT